MVKKTKPDKLSGEVRHRRIRVGFDFDGVIAYNPFRIIRWPVAFWKRKVLGIKKLSFFHPRNEFERQVWKFVHNSSVFPAKGTSLLKELVAGEQIEAHLITARYSFLDDQLYKWLERHELKHIFKTINMNIKDEQPHIFKEKTIAKYKLDYFIEDNLDIVSHLHGRSRTKIIWIYNLLDTYLMQYERKHPYLEKALREIIGKDDRR